MKRGGYLAVLGVVLLGAGVVGTGETQTAISADGVVESTSGGFKFPDGTVQDTAAQVVLIGPALVPRTGQTTSAEANDDGDLQRGVAWPSPRFTKNGDGTVTDNLTGLIWLEDADCFGVQSWSVALSKAAALFDGCGDCGGTNNDCGLGDGSAAGLWRLPNLREVNSLTHYGVSDPVVPDTVGTGQWSEGDPFSGISGFYWSSTTAADDAALAWIVYLGTDGNVTRDVKIFSNRVWLVRGGP